MVGTASAASAQGVVKVGLVTVLSGPFAEFGQQMKTGIEVYLQQHGDTVAGNKVEIIYRDAGGPQPAAAKRIATELVTQDGANILAGFVFTPNALSVAPVATQAHVPMIVMNAAGANLTRHSPFMVRLSFDFNTMVPPIARWALKQGYKKAYVLVADYAPGHDVETAFIKAFKEGGGEIVGAVRTPLQTLDFAPYLQRVKDTRPNVLFAFVNGGDVGTSFMREFHMRGLGKAGVKLIGTGDIVYEPDLAAMGNSPIGVVTVYPYSSSHPSALNKKFVTAFKALRGAKAQPTIMAVAAYDGMASIYAALEKTHGNAAGAALVDAMKGLKLESPRGPIEIDPKTCDVVQREYIRRTERVDGVLQNVEFASFPPGK
jgi:branched-chain amino acid transport system substrate-binding protein